MSRDNIITTWGNYIRRKIALQLFSTYWRQGGMVSGWPCSVQQMVLMRVRFEQLPCGRNASNLFEPSQDTALLRSSDTEVRVPCSTSPLPSHQKSMAAKQGEDPWINRGNSSREAEPTMLHVLSVNMMLQLAPAPCRDNIPLAALRRAFSGRRAPQSCPWSCSSLPLTLTYCYMLPLQALSSHGTGRISGNFICQLKTFLNNRLIFVSVVVQLLLN